MVGLLGQFVFVFPSEWKCNIDNRMQYTPLHAKLDSDNTPSDIIVMTCMQCCHALFGCSTRELLIESRFI